MKNNECECSSLKFFNFEGWSLEKKLDKYEVVLTSREKQITDLSIEIGSLNDRVAFLSDKWKSAQEEMEMLKNRLQKRENILNQELNNKEIMFMRLERAEQECDDLKKKLERATGNKGKEYQLKETNYSDRAPNFSFIKEGSHGKDNVFADNKNIITTGNNKGSSVETIKSTLSENKIGDKNIEVKATTGQKPSALDKIRELKERKNYPSNRISLTGSMIETNPNSGNATEVTSVSADANTNINENVEATYTPKTTGTNTYQDQ